MLLFPTSQEKPPSRETLRSSARGSCPEFLQAGWPILCAAITVCLRCGTRKFRQGQWSNIPGQQRISPGMLLNAKANFLGRQ